MSLSLSFFKNKKIFITGHTGFKGSWLAYILYDAGAIVTGFALDPVGDKNHFNLLNLENKIHHIVVYIRDKKNLESAILYTLSVYGINMHFNFSPEVITIV